MAFQVCSGVFASVLDMFQVFHLSSVQTHVANILSGYALKEDRVLHILQGCR
jgi:hypothetical protein